MDVKEIYNQLEKSFEIDYLSPINPKVSKHEQIISKANQWLCLKRHFEFFSEKRLELVSQEFYKEINTTSSFLFFHGTTPWVKCKSDKPYFAYVDATFLTYLDIYLNPNNYKQREIHRIVEQERQFLNNAAGIFFSSEWAKRETINRYGITGSNFYCVGLGGNALLSANAVTPETPSLLFVSMDFKRKGGHIAYQSFVALKKQFSGLTLQIIGDSPSQNIINTEGVIYHGFIDKKTKEGQQQFDNIFQSASFLIHPTEKDMTPLIVVEAGYYGIPTIAPSRFGIPEMIKNGETGYLVANNSVNEYAEKLSTILNQQESLRKMKEHTHQFMSNHFTWDNVGKRITSIINNTLKP